MPPALKGGPGGAGAPQENCRATVREGGDRVFVHGHHMRDEGGWDLGVITSHPTPPRRKYEKNHEYLWVIHGRSLDSVDYV